MTDTPARHELKLDETMLTPLVRDLLANTQAHLLDWSAQPLEGGFSGAAIYRIQGHAQTAGDTQPWSLILKVITPALGSPEPTAWDYWKREVLVYQSAILAGLPQVLVAPRCFAITEQPDAEFWLWLEDMVETETAPWSLERFGLAARHLGQWNGSFLVNATLPQAPWWRSADVRQRFVLAEPGISQLATLRDHPLFIELLTGHTVARVHQLWAERDQFLGALDRLPSTFCHRDSVPRNLMSRQRSDGTAATVILDWGMAGHGLLGEEIIPLFAGTLQFFEVEIARIAELEGLIFAGYLAGLRMAGWQGDERLVRFGFTALAALKHGMADPAIKFPRIAQRAAALPVGTEPPRLLSPGGYAQAAALQAHLLEMGDEARALLWDLLHCKQNLCDSF